MAVYLAYLFIYSHRCRRVKKRKKENAVAVFLFLFLNSWPFASYPHARTHYTVLHPACVFFSSLFSFALRTVQFQEFEKERVYTVCQKAKANVREGEVEEEKQHQALIQNI